MKGRVPMLLAALCFGFLAGATASHIVGCDGDGNDNPYVSVPVRTAQVTDGWVRTPDKPPTFQPWSSIRVDGTEDQKQVDSNGDTVIVTVEFWAYVDGETGAITGKPEGGFWHTQAEADSAGHEASLRYLKNMND